MIGWPTCMATRAGVDAVFVASWLAAGAALWLGVVQRALDERHSAVEQQALVTQLEDEAAQGARQLAAKRAQGEALSGQLSRMTLRLAGVGTLNQRLAQLTALASDVGQQQAGVLKLEQITPGAPEAGARSTAVPIRLVGVGGYAGAADLLARIRARFPDTGVHGFALARSVEDAGGQGTFRVDLVWYAAPSEGAP